jgi:hypothetical protein
MLEALDLYLSTAPLGELLTVVGLAFIEIGWGPFVPGHIADHVAAVRGGR